MIVFSLVLVVCYSQENALKYIDLVDLKKHLSFIASDSLQGRSPGTKVDGLGITADYLAQYSGNIGLLPGSENYFQQIPLVLTNQGEDNFFELTDSASISVFKSYSIIKMGGNLEKKLSKREIVFTGFGYSDKETGNSDFENTDLKNKVVVVAQGNAQDYSSENDYRWNNRLERGKIEQISSNEPAAIVIITNPKDTKNETFRQIHRWFSRPRYELQGARNAVNDREPPVFIALPELADEILGSRGSFKKYLSQISKNKIPEVLSFNKVLLNIELNNHVKPVDAKNVIGIVEGSDPVLKNECVVFMAHYDHLGVSSNGDIYNGADDNGSGVVTLMEVAEAFMSLPEKPKRSVVFLWVTAEEIGLLGSRFYTENPVFPLENTKACINIDMDGRVYEPRDSVWNHSPKRVKDFDGLFTLGNNIWPGLNEISDSLCKSLGLVPDNSLPPQFLRSSDHYHFHNNKVPILNYATGYHADYHKQGDEISKINFEKIKRVSDLCFLVGLEIANMDFIE